MTNNKKILVKDLNLKLKKAIAEDIKHAKNKKSLKMTRTEIAKAMTIILGEEVTKTTLNNWTATSHTRHRFPILYLPALCRVTGQRRALTLILRSSILEVDLNMQIAKVNKKLCGLAEKKKQLEVLKNEIS